MTDALRLLCFPGIAVAAAGWLWGAMVVVQHLVRGRGSPPQTRGR